MPRNDLLPFPAPAPAPLRGLVRVSDEVRRENGRLAKRDLLAAYLTGVAPEDVGLAAVFLSGEIPQGRLQIGWRMVARSEGGPAGAPSDPQLDLPLFEEASSPAPLLLRDVDAAFTELRAARGRGATLARRRLLSRLLHRAGPDEADFLRRLLLGELRQGALRALIVEALAAAFGASEDALRRALTFAGDFRPVAEALARDGESALRRFSARPLVPVLPMLAGSVPDLAAVQEEEFPLAVEWKLDGVRVQLHRQGAEVRVFTRRLRDVTHSLPELVALGSALSARSFILDGEVIGRDRAGRPVPFQDLMSAVSREPAPRRRERVPRASHDAAPDSASNAPPAQRPRLIPVFFDLLYLDGHPFVQRPFRERRAALERLLPAARVIQHRVARRAVEARAMYDRALAAGHEGILLKELGAPYTAGRRGNAWRKVKPAVTLDLVVLAAEWGSGRRHGLLSNLHLGARVEGEPGRFLMLGKTFKGLTDDMLLELTDELPRIETRRDDWTVYVRPERVVEVAFDGLQRSARYDSGLALRFARVKRFRPDKEAGDAATIEEVRRLAERQAPR